MKTAMRQLQDFRLHYYNSCKNVMLTVVYGDGATETIEVSPFDAVELSVYIYSGRVKLAENKIEEWLNHLNEY